MNSAKWTIRDVITTVLMSVLLIVIQVVINVVCMPNDFVSMVLSTPIHVGICGIAYVLMITRVAKRGVTLVYTTMVGVVYLISGNWYLLPWYVLVGVICEIILWKKDSYQKSAKVIAAWGVNGLLHQGTNFLPIAFFWSTYYNFAMQSGMEQSYVDSYLNYFTHPGWVTLIVVLTLGFALLGAFIGTRLTKKHFEKAGVL